MAWRCWLQLLWLNCLVPREMAVSPHLVNWTCKSGLLEYPWFRISCNQAHPTNLGVVVCRYVGAAARNLEAGSSPGQYMLLLKVPKAWAHNWQYLVDRVLHHTGHSTISTLSRQSSPPHAYLPMIVRASRNFECLEITHYLYPAGN